jgi:hypothetical protein
MSRRGKARLAFLIAALAFATVPFGSMMAQAHEKTFKSNLTLHYDKHADEFNGHLGTAEVCKDERPVDVHLDVPGSPVVATAITDHSGQWGPVSNTTGPGTYFATVDAVDRGGYGDPVHCEAGVSNTVEVPA